MPKFTFICDHSCDLDTHVVTHQFNAETYWEVIEQFEMFLKGAGYSFDGAVGIIPPVEDYSDYGGGSTLADYPEFSKHSSHYFDKDRNK